MPEITDFAFIAGQWQGTVGADAIDEVWSTVAGGTLMGMFRWLKDEGVYLYEFQTIQQEGASITLRIKHFNSDLVGWEDKDVSTVFDCEWVKSDEVAFLKRGDAQQFMRLIYRQPDANTLIAITQMDEQGENQSEFIYQRH